MRLSHEEWKQINEIIIKINMSGNECVMRENIMEAISEVIYYDFGDFCYAIEEDKSYTIMDPVVVTRFPKAFQEDYENIYQKYYSSKDYTKWCLNSKESIVFRESDIIKNEIRLKTEFYNDFLLPRNLIYSLGCYIIKTKGDPGAIALYRVEEKGNFSKKDEYILNLLLPHIENRMISDESFKFDIDRAKNNEALFLRSKYGLTWREIEITGLIIQGKTNKELCEALYISLFTVKKHITHIFHKTGTSSRFKLAQLMKQIEKETD